MSKYKEIFKLKKMLEDAEIPFEFIDRFEDMVPEEKREAMRLACPDFEWYQICYPSNSNRWISVIQGLGTYGAEWDKLEIMGGLTPLERYKMGTESVIGWLTARNVFKRIKNHYEEEKIKWKKQS